MDEEAFLRAIGAAPDDHTVRLVYADWLEERADPRAELVRLQVRLREAADDDPSHAPLQAREQELRAGCPVYWLARLDPPVWCVVGNIVDTRPSVVGEGARHGTRLFRPNAKIFLATRNHWHALLAPDRYARESIEVVGQHRKSREWIGSWVRVALTANWRVRLVHHPGALVRLREAGWAGFWLRPHEFQCPPERGSVECLQALFEAIFATLRRPE
ncbi:TIGR02996 domain-containing protein [Fimbriiglobus ruber]|uniref:TIGR02996 domain-containing protein n=1 Tax=Fimbriiglobus ruber TaxID=1908690 RepID=A0A225DAP7_9BACT|nr:TIGR02996 domain-containing protein [Fimbriiglobus ruber]OWK36734.1 hypothetical protein FRUB_09297 [Fimbriiglobus ruber]